VAAGWKRSKTAAGKSRERKPPAAYPTIASYNATSSLVRLENKNIFSKYEKLF
jgi:hypothetical protein